MRASRVALVAIPVAAGVAFGLYLPRWRTITIEFAAGGRAFAVQGAPRLLPGTMLVDDDGRLRLRVINRDSVPHQAGVLALAARDSTEVGAELCTGQGHGGSRSILLR